MQTTFAAERNARAAHAIAVLLEEAALARENGEALSVNLDRGHQVSFKRLWLSCCARLPDRAGKGWQLRGPPAGSSAVLRGGVFLPALGRSLARLLHQAQPLVGQLLGHQLEHVGAALGRQCCQLRSGLLAQRHGFHSVIMERSS